MKFEKTMVLLLLLCLAGLLLSGCGESGQELHEALTYTNDGNFPEYILENEYFKLTMDGGTSQFSLLDKETGCVWDSNPASAADDPAADPITRENMQSPLIITTVDLLDHRMDYNVWQYSICNETFSISQSNEGLRVDYTIGNAKKNYRYPECVPEEEFREMLQEMDIDSRKIVVRNYTKVDLNNLREGADAEYLLSVCPGLAEGNYYIIYALTISEERENPELQLKQLNDIFSEIGYSEEDYLRHRRANYVEKSEGRYNVSLIYRLDGNSFVVEIPEDLISYPDSAPIKSIKVLPYFCAGGTEDEGFLFVPDGPGAIIRLNNGKVKAQMYYSSVYGWDEAFSRETRSLDTVSEYPVFGILKNRAYLLCITENGAGDLSVQADISGKNSSYNNVFPIFNVVHCEKVTITAKWDTKAMEVYQNERPCETITMRYYSGSGDSFIDMAHCFRRYLMETYPNLKSREEGGMPMAIELIGAIDTTQKVLGVPVRLPTAAVDYKEASAIVSSLSDAGITNVYFRYSGIFNGGLNQTSLSGEAALVSKIGSVDDLNRLIGLISQTGGTICAGGYVNTVLDDRAFDGFSRFRNATRDLTDEVIERYPYNQVTQALSQEKDDKIYLLKLDDVQKAFSNLCDKALTLGFDGVSIADAGYLLYSDFNSKSETVRSRYLEEEKNMLAQFAGEGSAIMISGANDYAAVYADFVTGMNLTGGAYNIFDEQVPFYPAVLHGLVNYSGEPMNLSNNATYTFLKSVECGAAPFYTFFEFSYSNLSGSKYTYNYRLFSANYSDWKEIIKSQYARLVSELKNTWTLEITAYSHVSESVTMTQYSDGTKVYVNYGGSDVFVDGVLVPAEDWAVGKDD